MEKVRIVLPERLQWKNSTCNERMELRKRLNANTKFGVIKRTEKCIYCINVDEKVMRKEIEEMIHELKN